MAQIHSSIEWLARGLEIVGVLTIIVGVIFASIWFIRQGRTSNWQDAFKAYRSNLGRGILLGLELLVGADIIGTVRAPLTFESVGLLGIVILTRTLLSFSLETEIEGCWPWKRRSFESAKLGRPS